MSTIGSPVGGGVIGGPVGMPASVGRGFNDVLASYSQQINIGANASLDILIPFSFASAAELDVVCRTANTLGECLHFSITGSPDGLLGRINVGGSTSTTITVQLVGNAIRVSNLAYTYVGRVQILRRNRRVKNYATLAGSTTETAIPFAITNADKTIVTGSTVPSPGGVSNFFVHNYFPMADTNSWHFNSTIQQVRITSATSYVSSFANSAFSITEFE